MKIVIFGLTISSSWGNGHATLWRSLCGGLARRGHRVVFFERDTTYYAGARDLCDADIVNLWLYPDWNDIAPAAKVQCTDADVVIVTSYCPDGLAATELALDSSAALKLFYDMDTPVTLGELRRGRALTYIGPRGLADFDLVLSFTGGGALVELRERLGARHVATLYGSVDPAVHHRRPVQPQYSADLSYLGTYAEDRQARLESLFIETARRMPWQRFVIGGAQYPHAFPWSQNIHFVRHLPPSEHAAFFSSSRLTLNVTRQAMAEMGYCPSGRLFEAAACGTPIISDHWEGLDEFFEPGQQILVAHECEDVAAAMSLGDVELKRISSSASERVLTECTGDRRAVELERACDAALRRDESLLVAHESKGRA